MVIKNHVLFALSGGVVALGLTPSIDPGAMALLPSIVVMIILSDLDYSRRYIGNGERWLFSIILGVSTSAWFIEGGSDPAILALTPLLVLGSALTDIDHPGSYVGSRLKFLSIPISVLVGHRKFFHTLLFVVLFAGFLIAYYGHSLAVSAIVFGYLTHIIADLLTGGIPLFWPLSNKKVSLPVLGWSLLAEKLFSYGFLSVALVWYFANNL